MKMMRDTAMLQEHVPQNGVYALVWCGYEYNPSHRSPEQRHSTPPIGTIEWTVV